VTISYTVLALATAGVLAAGHVAVAQTPPTPQDQRAAASARRLGGLDPARVTMLRNRYHVRQMESVLVRAVEHAAELMTHRLTTVSPDVMALAGAPRAQGFLIDGYGLFFAVEVPRLSDSMTWALQVLADNHDQRTLASLRRLADAQTDPVLRADLEQAIRSLQRQMARTTPTTSPQGADPRSVATSHGPSSGPVAAPPAVPASAPTGPAATGVSAETVDASTSDDADAAAMLLANPSGAYEDEVKAALSDALLDYALTLPLSPGERVTVAARDAGYIAFPDALAEMVTVTLSVKVDDLLELHAQRIDRAEARRRVVVREF
jgi:hypothetical protein